MLGGQTPAAEAQQPHHSDGPDQDVEMRDASQNEESDVDAEGEMDDGGEEVASSRDLRQLIQDVSTYLCEVEENGEELAAGFQRIPNRRVLPDYFEVISEPTAFSTVRGKLLRKQYNLFGEFVKDVSQICHNAQVYNRPSAPIFGAAVRLREIFKEKLRELVKNGQITEDDAKLPDLGDLPPVDDSPLVSEEEGHLEDDDDEDEDDEDDEDEEDEDDSSDDENGRRRRGPGRRRLSIAGRRDRDDKEEDSHKKRGRPPSVFTPTEARIHAILKGLRKFKADDGTLLVLPFEKLPDKATIPHYYQTIANPIALDNIKKKAKRKKYQNVDHAMADVDLMFGNATLFNEDDSPVYLAAVELQKQARVMAEYEKARPDDDFRDEDGKLPMAFIDHQGEAWRVGDWIHIRNPNDLGKPIVAQIYRTWQDRAGQRWINACWYYRPEQTVHRFDKHFFDHEVVKTGQYRDHQIDDVLDRCFVMFITRFGRGRPRGLPADKEVYVCESRYNEERFTFNKIKTWASCVPDEVREKDYEMDLFEVPRRMRKTPSPIKHLLREDAKDTDDIPKPTWGTLNAPPIVGAVHRRPRESNESPPPEPTPPPQSHPPVSELPLDLNRRSSMLSQTGVVGNTMPTGPLTSTFSYAPGPSPSPSQFHSHMTPNFQPPTPGSGLSAMNQTPVPIPQPPAPPQMQMHTMQYQQQHRFAQSTPNYHPTSGAQMHHQQMQNTLTYTQGYNQNPPPPISRPSIAPTSSTLLGTNVYNPPRPSEVYTLPDAVNEALPHDLRDAFHSDSQGRVFFFTSPPLDRTHEGPLSSYSGLGHSAKYLAGRDEWLLERGRKRKEREEKHSISLENNTPVQELSTDGEQLLLSQAAYLVERHFQKFDADTAQWNKDTGLEGWVART